MKKTIFSICVLLITLSSQGLGLAADKWEFIIAPYALVPSIDGDASIGRVEGADIDVGPDDIINNLDSQWVNQGIGNLHGLYVLSAVVEIAQDKNFPFFWSGNFASAPRDDNHAAIG